MKKRKNIIISAITCMMSICLMMFGVYAASNPSVSISGQVSYSARDAKVLVLGKVNGQAGDDSNVDYPSVADATNPQEDEKVVKASQYMGFTNGTGVNDETDDLAPWAMNTTHAFYEDSTGIRPITISFMLRNLSNYPVVATVDFTGVTDADLASKNLTRETTGMTDDNEVYLDKGRAKEISITYDVANDAVGVNGNALLDMSIKFERTVFPETMKGEVQIDGQTINQSDWVYSFDGDGFTVAKFLGEFPQKDSDGNSTLEIPSQVKCEDGTVYPIKTIGTLTEYDFMKEMASENAEKLYAALVILDIEKAQTDETYMDKAPSNIVLPEGLEAIGAVAFLETAGVKSLPNTVKEIGSFACAGTSITTLNLPNLTKVGVSAFEGAPLSTVVIEQEDPTKISIAEGAFGGVSSDSTLQIYVPTEDYKTATNWSAYESVMKVGIVINGWNIKINKTNSTCEIEEYVGDMTQETLTVPAKFDYKGKIYKTQSIGDSTQDSSELDDAKFVFKACKAIPDSTYALGIALGWFESAGLADYLKQEFGLEIMVPQFKKIIVEDGIETIGYFGFAGCIYLEQIELPSSLKTVGHNALAYCRSLKQLSLPEGLEQIKWGAFGLCRNLDSISIPANVKSIGENAFAGCSKLSTITIPSGVTSIGEGAFEDCYHLAEVINLSSASLNNTKVEEYAVRIATSGTTKITNDSDFKFVQGNDGIDYLVGYFGEDATNLVLPSKSTNYKIKKYAFYGNSNIFSLTIPQCVTGTGYKTFDGCYRLSEVINMSNAGDSDLDRYAVRTATSGTSQIQTQDGFKFVLGDDGYNYLIGYCGDKNFYKDGEISLPQTTSNYRIKSYAFSGFEMPEILVIPNCVNYIGDYAFSGGTSDFSVTVPDSVTYIGDMSFSQNDGFDSTGISGNITIGSGVTMINGFIGCTGTLTIKATVPPTLSGFIMLNGTPSAIYVPAESVDAYKNADGWNTYADRIYAIS